MTKFDKLLSVIKKDHIFLQMHNYPDQDALASAKALQFLLETKGIASTICYKGHIDKPNTLKMIEELHIDIHSFKELDILDDDEIILIDCQKGNSNVKDFIGKEIACIDHHKSPFLYTYEFADIRSDIGACSTILASYFLENHLEIPSEIATALTYGIQTDTSNLHRAVSDLDIDMFCYLYKRASHDSLRRFDCCGLKITDLAAYHQAIADLRVHNHVGLANIGNDCSEAIIGSVSDFLLTLSEVYFTLVYSYRTGGVKYSVRSENDFLDASIIIRQALDGLGDGGGHSTMAAGFIPNITSEEEAKQVSQQVEERILKLVAK